MKNEIDFLRNLGEKEHKPLSNKLFHAMKPEHALIALNSGFMEPRTSHRFWLDGKRRTDTDPEYEASSWMKGFSFTRSREYAEKWGSVVLEFDRDQIRQNFKTVLLSWNFIMSSNRSVHTKKETEEFIYCGGTHPSLDVLKEIDRVRDEKIDQLYDTIHAMGKDLDENQKRFVYDLKQSLEKLDKEPNWFKVFTDTPMGRNLDVAKYCKRIYVPNKNKEFIDEHYPELEKHSLFKKINGNLANERGSLNSKPFKMGF